MREFMVYLVATPIGNLGDLSSRALETLAKVDFIAAEDTRVTSKLLNHFNIKKPLVSYYEHNKREKGLQMIERIKNGETCALVTDAGMPCISDPGEDFVRLCIEEGIEYTVIPGANAALCALSLSGFVTGRFAFEGFLSMNKKNRKSHLESIKNDSRTLIFYEAPHKLKSTLSDFLDYLGDRNVAVIRELTKIYEQTIRGTLSEVLSHFNDTAPKGEFVIIIEGNETREDKQDEFWKELTVEEHIKFYADQGLAKMDAVKAVAKDRDMKKNEIYKFTI